MGAKTRSGGQFIFAVHIDFLHRGNVDANKKNGLKKQEYVNKYAELQCVEMSVLFQKYTLKNTVEVNKNANG